MLTKEQVLKLIGDVTVPGTSLSAVKLGLITDISVVDKEVSLSLADCAVPDKIVEMLELVVRDRLSRAPGISAVSVTRVEKNPSDLNRVKQVIVVMSGKGGVGKSTVSGLIAVSLKRLGYEVGILDADITGPSIPKMFGLSEKPLGNQKGFLPVATSSGIRVMSINLVMGNGTDAVIWRGPLIAKAISQFWTDVLWGELDYLIVDLPPGTSDAALTTIQQIPVTGVVMVTTPQGLAGLIVRKAIDMVGKMDVPILGLVENMAYYADPTTGEKIEIFGPSQTDSLLSDNNLTLLGKIPVDPQLTTLCDQGNMEQYQGEAVTMLGQKLLDSLAK